MSDSDEEIKDKLTRIETALYGTGNPHGGLFQQFATLNGKVDTLDAKIDGVEKRLDAKIDGVKETLTAKIDGLEKKFDKMFNFIKWVIVVVVIPIAIDILLPIIKKWIG